ncbi:hypothetical protein [Yersinia pseudotuberculosis]|uniref:hypothetical protein n=1 Tax=Yersinia pseudotuberculosis TaxID=633 RepID=UPI00067DA156|nr:hypothetical protein [Yersinia pseudotuberculosis]
MKNLPDAYSLFPHIGKDTDPPPCSKLFDKFFKLTNPHGLSLLANQAVHVPGFSKVERQMSHQGRNSVQLRLADCKDKK